MIEESYEEEMLRRLAVPIAEGKIEVIDDLNAYLAALEASFPFIGSKVDWSKVPGAITVLVDEHGVREDIGNDFAFFLKSIVDSQHLDGPIVFAGDGPMEIVFRSSMNDMLSWIPVLSEIPQHRYVFPYPVVSWCAQLSLEGDMDFGYSPLETN